MNCEHVPNVDISDFDLTCDVIGDFDVNKIKFRSTNLAELSNTVLIWKISSAVSEIEGRLILVPPQVRRGMYLPQWGTG